MFYFELRGKCSLTTPKHMQINKTTLVPPCSLYFAVSFLKTQGTVEVLVVLKSQHILQLSFGGSLSKSNVPNRDWKRYTKIIYLGFHLLLCRCDFRSGKEKLFSLEDASKIYSDICLNKNVTTSWISSFKKNKLFNCTWLLGNT